MSSIVNIPQPKRNIFLEDMCFEDDEKKDLRGWNYEHDCSCWRCNHFHDAAYYLVQLKETGEYPPRLEYDKENKTPDEQS